MTIEEFARRIGVSTATVSRAIHGKGRISPQTRQMILQRMEELGFTPNLHAQSLAGRRSRIIGLEYLGRTEVLSDMFLIALARGIQHVLSSYGYTLLLNPMGVSDDQESLLYQWTRSRIVDGGIVVGNPDVPADWLRALTAHRTCCIVVAHHPPPRLPRVGCVVLDLSQGVAQAAELFCSMGHCRIGYIGSIEPDPVLPMLREHVQARGGCIPLEMVVYAGLTPEEGARAARLLIRRHPCPTAIFVRTDVLALGVVQAIREEGLRLPEDISIISHDDVPFAQYTDPPLTTVRVDYEQLGKSAVEMLLAMLERREPAELQRTVHTSLVQRATVAPPLHHKTSSRIGGI
ncbi:MAG: LacI family DNA-binding transcriptional regulator [Armatimonadota bacterium]|nr:LacI family transcriptional regulator [Armatimonadota bacterium]MDW8104296.1 LacI family DNA-binding transcriptional regulator [Armatimonadota bacterium]